MSIWKQEQAKLKVKRNKEIVYMLLGSAFVLIMMGIAGSGTYPY